MREEQLKSFAKVSCPCGNTVRIDTMSEQRSFRCPVCAQLISFVVTVDRATKRPKVSIVVKPDAIRQEVGDSLGASSRAPEASAPPPQPPAPRPRPPARGVFGTCACGEEFPVDEHELTTIQPCPRCGVRYHVVVKADRATKERSAILVPVDGVKPQRSRAMPVQKAPKTIKKVRLTSAPRTKVSVPKPPPVIPPGAQAVVCSCGETLVVRRKDVESGLTCGACGKALRLMEDRDPQTLAPRIRLRPDPKK